MILSKQAIQEAVEQGTISISPFDASLLNPASYDLQLGPIVRVYKDWVSEAYPTKDKDGHLLRPRDTTLDTKNTLETISYRIDNRVGFVLLPGIGYLMHTKQRIKTNQFVPVVDGKSSLGRLFMQVHMTAGYIDPGFDGQYTLEVIVQHPIRIYAGMRIAQVRFHAIEGEVNLYHGHYVGEDHSQGPVASRFYKTLQEDKIL